MTKTDERIIELEIQAADFRAQLAELRAQLASRPAPVMPATPPKPRAFVEEGATVTYPVATNRAFVMAGSDELDQLLAIVCRRYSHLRAGIKPGRFASQDEADFRNEFEAAFRALGSISRMPAGEVDEKHYADRWIRVVQGRLQGGSQAMHLLPLTTAVIAHGDIPFMLSPADMMASGFGLRDDNTGIPASDKWRHVLASNTAPSSLPLPRHRAWSMGMSVNGAR